MSYFGDNDGLGFNRNNFFLPKSKNEKRIFEHDGNYFDEVMSSKNQNPFGNGFNFFGNEPKQQSKQKPIQRKVKQNSRQRVQSSAEIRGLALGIARSKMTKLTSNKIKELRDKTRMKLGE